MQKLILPWWDLWSLKCWLVYSAKNDIASHKTYLQEIFFNTNVVAAH